MPSCTAWPHLRPGPWHRHAPADRGPRRVVAGSRSASPRGRFRRLPGHLRPWALDGGDVGRRLGRLDRERRQGRLVRARARASVTTPPPSPSSTATPSPMSRLAATRPSPYASWVWMSPSPRPWTGSTPTCGASSVCWPSPTRTPTRWPPTCRRCSPATSASCPVTCTSRSSAPAGPVSAAIDLDVTVEPGAAPILKTMLEMFDLADAFCKAERLLSIQRTPEQRAFHIWYLSEYIRQIDGEPPITFRESDSARSLGNQQVSCDHARPRPSGRGLAAAPPRVR